MAVAAPDRLHYTDSDEANQLLATDPLALLIGFALDQQVTVQQAFSGPLKIKQRLGTLEIANRDPAEVEAAFRETPAVHRFPGSMAGRVQKVAAYVAEHYGNDAANIWADASTGAELLKRLKALPGFGEQKAKIMVALLGKQIGVRPDGWREAAGDYGVEGATRSVADVVDADTLTQVRATKREIKRAAKA
jgi:uncharacterized HhH-GPD family protein